MSISYRNICALALVGAMAISGRALAAPAVKDACKTEIREMCAAEYAARSREKAKMCLIANLEKVSEQCRVAVDAQMAANKKN